MSLSGGFKILIAAVDGQLRHQLSQKVRARFASVPLEIDVAQDGKQAINEYRLKGHGLLILDINLAGIDGLEMAREVRKVDGGAGIFLLGAAASGTVEGVESVDLPIVDWTTLLNRIQNFFPDELKARYGLFERDTALYNQLVEYGRKYIATAPVSSDAHDALILIPNFFPGAEVPLEKVTAADAGKASVARLQIQASNWRALSLELCLLGMLITATVGVYFVHFQDGSAWLALRLPIAGLTGLAVLGFFLGRAFERMFVKT
jgi:CheY-like chemotaxis protein